MIKYAAHVRPSDLEEQTVADHCLQTAALAARYGKGAGLSQTAALAAVLHDIGKLTTAFNDYVHDRAHFHRGELDHSFAGARYLKELAASSDDRNLKKTAALIGRVILSHHGLHDWLTADAEDTYQQRTAKNQ